MKKIITAFLTCSLLLVSCSRIQTPAGPTATSGPDLLDTPWEDRSIFKAGLVTTEQLVLDELPEASVYHLEFKIAEDLYHITGMEEVHYTNAEETALNEVHFRLFPNILGGEMKISNLTVDGTSAAPRLELENSLMVVPLSQALEPGQSVVLRMDLMSPSREMST